MLDGIAEFFIFGFAPLMVGILAVPEPSGAAETAVTGEVTYRERIALPPNTVLTVQLTDVSLADAPAAIVAEHMVDPAGQVPISFELKFESSAIRPKMTYVLQARITVDDKLLFINDERHQVDPLSNAPQKIVLKRVAQKDDAGDTIFNRDWVLEFSAGAGSLPQRKPTFRIDETGKAGGRGPCNSYFAAANVDGVKISISGVGSTRMACAPEVMEAETAFFEALAKAESFRMDDGQLVISGGGVELLRFSAAS